MSHKIGIVGLGYVGLPLAIEFGKKYETIGYDHDKKRIDELKKFIDRTKEISLKDIKSSKKIKFSSSFSDLKKCNFFIICVPTPISKNKKPNLIPIKNASKNVGKVLKPDDVVIYESTVYPGTTEEICVPILERESDLDYICEINKKNILKGFYCGYSPERINPGDKKNKITNILKVTSGSTTEISKKIDKLYKSIIPAGTFLAESIKVAEAAKIIENTQRDLNIALINELSIIFDKMSIDTHSVLKAAETKWNFHSFKPGLVGGHCIGVDPYYLTFKSLALGYVPEVILSGRKINDSMPKYVSNKLLKLVSTNGISYKKAKILFLGATFKENCPDIRNSKSIELMEILVKKFKQVDCFDPYITSKSISQLVKKINFVTKPKKNYYDLIVISVAHNFFKKLGIKKINSFGKRNKIVFDIKSIFNKDLTDGSL